MGSGFRAIQVNTSERAISSDINRLQAFLGAGIGDVMRALLDTTANDDLDAGAVASAFSSLTSPLRAEVLTGLMVRPDPAGGTLNLGVDPGVLFAIAPTGSGDDSLYQYVNDPGVTNGGLTLAAGGGGTRYDVVECQINATPATVTASRDVFNPTTGLFSATTVTKESKAQLTYRVRQGTPGGAFPGTATGWLPLMVAQVESSATSNDQIVFWDVRHMVSDRIRQPHALSVSKPKPWAGETLLNATTLATTGGLVEAWVGGRRLGGRLRSGTDAIALAADAETIDLTSARNREASFSTVANQLWYLYACVPFGLPRWARYTTGPAGRVPRSPRGVFLMSTVAPDAFGRPSTVIGLPSPWPASATVATTEAVCVACGYADGANTLRGFYGDAHGVQLRCDELEGSVQPSPPILAGVETSSTGTDFFSTFTFVPGTHFPPHARWVLFEFWGHYITDNTGGALKRFRNFVKVNNGFIFEGTHSFNDDTANAVTESFVAYSKWLPVPPPYPSSTAANLVVANDLRAGGLALTTQASKGRIIGYRF